MATEPRRGGPRRAVRRGSRAVRHTLAFGAARLLTSRIGTLSLPSLVRIGEVTGRLGWGHATKERRRILTQLRFAFPERSGDWIARTGRAVFERQGRSMAMTAHVGLADPEALLQIIDGTEVFDYFAKWAPPGEKAPVGVCPHLGPFILMASVAARVIPIEILIRPPRLTWVGEMENRLFDGLGVPTRPQGDPLRPMIRAIRNRTVIAMAADHDVRRIGGCFVPFFGKLAYTPIGPAALARMARTRMMIGFAIPVDRPRRGQPPYVGRIVDVPLQRTDDSEADITENTRRWMAITEAYIRAYPAEWTWMNRRWRTRPDDKPKAAIWDARRHQLEPFEVPGVRRA